VNGDSEQMDLGSLALENSAELCLGIEFESALERRAHFGKELASFLETEECATWPGMPIGDSDAIIRMSDPPFFVASANPFLARLIPSRSDASNNQVESPYTADVSEGKSDPIYLAHGYHTKVPHRAIIRYILHYTQPGDVVLDGFAGTGMTGVAAQLCGSRRELEEMGYQVDSSGVIREEGNRVVSNLGARFPVMYELSPAAGLIAHLLNSAGSRKRAAAEYQSLLRKVEEEIEWAYITLRAKGPCDAETIAKRIEECRSSDDLRNVIAGLDREAILPVNYWIWSHVLACRECGHEAAFWDLGVDVDNGEVRDSFRCPGCSAQQSKRDLDLVWQTKFDPILGRPHRSIRSQMVVVNCSQQNGNASIKPTAFDHALAEALERFEPTGHVPLREVPKGDKTGEPLRLGMTHFHHFYTARNIAALASVNQNATVPAAHALVTAVCQRASRQHQIAISRVGGPKAGVGGATAGHRRGTLYMPTNSVEYNAVRLLRDRVDALHKLGERMTGTDGEYALSICSAEATGLPSESVDYIFVDPPFGGNIIYSDLNSGWEAWLDVFTRQSREAIESKHQGKGLSDYIEILAACFEEFYRVLKVGRWISVEFHNSRNAVWNAIQEALQRAGFIVSDVSILDKKIKTHTQRTASGSVNKDLVITAYKPISGIGNQIDDEGNTANGIWDFVDEHLRRLPMISTERDIAAVIPERQRDLLFDRMVAAHVVRGLSVPISAPAFYAGLDERYPVREGMYFLHQQIPEFDKKRTTVGALRQLTLFVVDEATATIWVRQQLIDRPQTFQQLQPDFMQQTQSWAKHERAIELSEILDLNFLHYTGDASVPAQIHSYLSSNFKELRKLDSDDSSLKAKASDRWYVPDAKKEGDLEKLRLRTLLKEFEEYQVWPKRKIKQFRTEAVRAGFKFCYDRQDYQAIVDVAGKLPEKIIQEDEKLLMYCDVAATRLGV
jgi:hypothetical protein